MNKKLLNLAFIMPLILVLFFPTTANAISVQSLGPGKMTYVIASSEDLRSVDPALVCDETSCEMIRNVYDTLIFPNGIDPNSFVPWLASSYSISPDGQTYTFTIRTNVQWHDPSFPDTVKPEDVEYSLERVLVRDYTGGPAWMLWYPILGLYKATDFGDLSDPAVAMMLGNLIDNAITSDTTSVTIHFLTGLPYPPFLGILAQTVGSVMNRNWAIYHGDWLDCGLDDGTWVRFHDPLTSPLDGPSGPNRNGFMMGSGPFEFNYWNVGYAWGLLRNGGQANDPHPNTTFWGGWGTNRLNFLGFTGVVSRGYVDEIAAYVESRSLIRLPGFLHENPVCDTTDVPILSIGSVWQQPGVKCIYPLHPLTVEGLRGCSSAMMSEWEVLTSGIRQAMDTSVKTA